VFSDFIKRQAITVTKESVVRKNAVESEFVDFAAIKDQSIMYKDYAETFASMLTEFLKDNEDTYPLYDCSCEETPEDWSIF
jgi:hypothetical protein